MRATKKLSFKGRTLSCFFFDSIRPLKRKHVLEESHISRTTVDPHIGTDKTYKGTCFYVSVAIYMELKGYLKPIILKILSRKDKKTGSELAEEIEDIIGSKPSYGSIYPILKDLKDKNLVETEKEGKKKKYSLLEKGEKFVEKFEEKRREQTENFLSMLRTFKTLFEDEDIEVLIKNIEKKKEQEKPQFPELSQIHHLLLTGDVEGNEEEIRTVLGDTLGDLEEILEG